MTIKYWCCIAYLKFRYSAYFCRAVMNVIHLQIVALRDFVTKLVGVTIMLTRMSYVYFSTTWWCYNVNINVSNILYPIPKNVKRGKMYGNTESIIWFLFGIEWQDGILLNLYDIFYIGRTLFYANLCHKSCFFVRATFMKQQFSKT